MHELYSTQGPQYACHRPRHREQSTVRVTCLLLNSTDVGDLLLISGCPGSLQYNGLCSSAWFHVSQTDIRNEHLM